MFWILVACVGALIFYYKFVKPLNYWKGLGVAYGSPIPVLGDNWKTVFKIQSLLELVTETYKIGPGQRYCGIFQGTQPTLILKDPDLIKQITVKDFDHFVDRRTFIDPESDPLGGKMLVALKGQEWKDMRGLLSPLFTSSKMRALFILMRDTAETFIENFMKTDEGIVETDMKNIFTRYANDIIASLAFGIKVDSLNDPENDFYMKGRRLTNFSGFWANLKMMTAMIFPKLFKFFKISLFGTEVNQFFRQLVEEAIRAREERGIVRPDLIHLLLEARKSEHTPMTNDRHANTELNPSELNKEKKHIEITNDVITSQALIFFFAGFDTISSMLGFTCYELAVHPDVQKRLREEVIRTSEECNAKVTYEHLQRMKYMDMVISESGRKWPIALVADRICTKPYTIEPVTPKEVPITLKQGDPVWVPIAGLHRDPEIFPDPEKFDPERFSEENKHQINSYTYLPFGVGPRNCIGNRFALLEAKVVLFQILKNFEIVPTAKTQIPMKISRKHFNLFPEGGFNMGLKRIAM